MYKGFSNVRSQWFCNQCIMLSFSFFSKISITYYGDFFMVIFFKVEQQIVLCVIVLKRVIMDFKAKQQLKSKLKNELKQEDE